jgi:hypothetical protein
MSLDNKLAPDVSDKLWDPKLDNAATRCGRARMRVSEMGRR